MTLEEALSRWEAAEQSLLAAELVFRDAVPLYLVRGGPDPSGLMAANVCQLRLVAAAALNEMLVVLEECRQAIRHSE